MTFHPAYIPIIAAISFIVIYFGYSQYLKITKIDTLRVIFIALITFVLGGFFGTNISNSRMYTKGFVNALDSVRTDMFPVIQRKMNESYAKGVKDCDSIHKLQNQQNTKWKKTKIQALIKMQRELQ